MSTVAQQAQATQSPAANVWANVPKTPKSKSGSDVPVVAIDAEYEEKLRLIVELTGALDDAEKHLKLKKSELLPPAEVLRRALSIAHKKHITSIALGASGVELQCQYKYEAIPLEEEDNLRARFNGRYDEFFGMATEVKVDPAKVSEEARKLLVRDGAITVKQFLKPTPAFHAARSTDASIAALADTSGLKPTTFLVVK